MLVLTRKIGQEIVLTVPPGAETRTIVVSVGDIRGDSVRIGIEAPREVAVWRRELWRQELQALLDKELLAKKEF